MYLSSHSGFQMIACIYKNDVNRRDAGQVVSLYILN